MRINVNNNAKLDKKLSECNGGARSHTAAVSDVQYEAARAESVLDKIGLTKQSRAGARVSVVSGSVLPKSYKYKVYRTHFVLERGTCAWYLVSCHRHEYYRDLPASNGVVSLSNSITESEVCRVFGQKLGFKVSQ